MTSVNRYDGKKSVIQERFGNRVPMVMGALKPTALAVAMLAAHGALAASQGIEEIIVTAQKRDQSLQEVPIAISALPAEALEVNRITSVMDLGSTTPNLTMREVAGGIGVPNFSMRGSVSLGSVPGTDKPISIYLDGVYIGSTFGSAFELPDIERIEVLRGPQGTLFGRNATAGAISVITRDPLGDFAVEQTLSAGNYDQFRSTTRVDLPAWGPLSTSLSFTHNERTGDIKNQGAGTTWDRSNPVTTFAHKGPDTNQGIQTSPKTLGDQNSDAIFAALMYEEDNIKAVYKYDWMENDFTPEGTALVAWNPGAAPQPELQAFAPFLNTMFAANSIPLAGKHRPTSVNNAWATEGHQITEGHNLTLTYDINEEMSLKNILAFRRSDIFANADISGASGLKMDPVLASIFGVPTGTPFVGGASNVAAEISQKSEELQFTLDKESWTLTTGLFYYKDDATNGAPDGMMGLAALTPIPGYVIASGQRNLSYNDAKSLAAYTQIEVNITDDIDLLAGYRFTKDEKSGTSYNFVGGTQFNSSFDYDDSRSSYMLGANYHLSPDILLYGKYSTGFVSGGSVSGLDFEPETVKSWEGGLKGDFLDRRLRANLSVFKADYKDIQSVIAGVTLNPPRPDVNTAILTEGDLDTHGLEVELTALPLDGLTLNASAGYTKVNFSNVNPIVRDPANSEDDTGRPEWTSNLSAMYETQPLFAMASLLFNVTASYRDDMRTLAQTNLPSDYDPILSSDAYWKINARIALRDIEVAGANVELALWGKNLTDVDNPTFPIYFNYLGSSTYERARTYGADLKIKF